MKLFKKRQQTGKPQKPKKSRRVKKNTWYRNFRAWALRLDHRQQQRFIPAVVDETERTCFNCGQVYTGRVCPQCGQAGTWKRYTWRQAFLNFLDIWGLGNRPMFRTIRELFWRPGYMIRDYLNGHRQYYFPPFKLLAVTIALLIFISWLTGIENESLFKMIADDEEFMNLSIDGPLMSLLDAAKWFVNLLSKNLLYEWLFIGGFILVCVWYAFRRVSKYNFVETYIFLIFILSQSLISNIPAFFLDTFFSFAKEHMVINIGNSFSLTLHPLGVYLDAIESQVYFVYAVVVFFLYIMDFHQFYGLKWKSTIKRLIRAVFIGILIIIVSMVLFSLIGEGNDRLMGATALGLMIVDFSIVAKFLRKNEAQINRTVSWTCKLSALAIITIAIGEEVAAKFGLNIYGRITGMVLYSAVIVALSIMPIYLYKKFHNKWISLLPIPLMVAFVLLIRHIIMS